MEDRHRDGRITLRRKLGKEDVTKVGGWNWLRTVFNCRDWN